MQEVISPSIPQHNSIAKPRVYQMSEVEMDRVIQSSHSNIEDKAAAYLYL